MVYEYLTGYAATGIGHYYGLTLFYSSNGNFYLYNGHIGCYTYFGRIACNSSFTRSVNMEIIIQMMLFHQKIKKMHISEIYLVIQQLQQEV